MVVPACQPGPLEFQKMPVLLAPAYHKYYRSERLLRVHYYIWSNDSFLILTHTMFHPGRVFPEINQTDSFSCTIVYNRTEHSQKATTYYLYL